MRASLHIRAMQTSRRSRAVIGASILAGALASALACGGNATAVTAAEHDAAVRAIRAEVTSAYDFSRPNVPQNLMALYAPTGPIVSASAGRVVTSRDTLRAELQTFWKYVGSNMRNPRVEWPFMHIDVLAPNAAVMTAVYRIPHTQPNGVQHVIGGAWTAAFRKAGDRWYIVQEHLSDDPTLAAAQMSMPMIDSATRR